LGRVDELGSGVLNVYTMIKNYEGQRQPLFIEGNIFSVQVPIPKRINEGAFEGATKVVKGKLIKIIQIIAINEGIRTPELQAKSGMTQKTLEWYLRMLRGYGMIKYIGEAPQTGGYFLTEKTRERIELHERISE
jgi:predicted HTH transcriptional regulator